MNGRLAVLLLLIGLSACSGQRSDKPAEGSVQHGDFMVEPLLPSSACSSESLARPSPVAQRIFYKGRLVTARALMPAFSPHNPGRVLFTAACSKDGSESGTFYFGEPLSAPVQVNPLAMYEPPKDFDLYWSPDDKFVVVHSSGGQSTLANLQTGTSSKFLRDLFESKDAHFPGLDFIGWSPDGKQMAVVVSDMNIHDDSSISSDYNLMAVDPSILNAKYVATIHHEGLSDDSWYGGKSIWVEKNGSYELAPDQRLKNDPDLTRKRP